MKIIFCSWLICILAFEAKYGNALQIRPKVDFIDSDTQHKPLIRNYHINTPLNKETEDPLAYTNTIVVNQNFGPKITKISDDDEVNVICKDKICVYGLDSVGSENNAKIKKTINEVSVIISTSDDNKKPPKDEGDVPVVKGYKGVRPEDINHEQNDDDENAKPKNGNEQPSIIVTHLPNSGNTVIIDTDKNGIQKPSFILQPPVFQAPNWRNNVNWKSRIPNIDLPNPQYYHRPQTPNIQHYHNDRPDTPITHYYQNDMLIGGSRIDNGYQTFNRDVRLPSGFASKWRPIIPRVPAADLYHYNVDGRGNDFSEWTPCFVTSVSCSRKPVYDNGAIQPKRPNPWFPETTTKMQIDDKLPKPFSKTSNK